MVEAPALSQGILVNNSMTPDVNIEEIKNAESVRSHLKDVLDKKPSTSKQYAEVRSKALPKSTYITKPISREHATTNENMLACEIAKLSSKLDNLEKQTQLQEKNQAELRTYELEKKLNDITDERLHYLEKLQHEQEQWKKQYLKTIEKLNEPKTVLQTDVGLNHASANRFGQQNTASDFSRPDLQKLLQTPLPRKEIPQPTTSSEQAGTGGFLRHILENNISTPNLSHSTKFGPVDTIPVRLTEPESANRQGIYNLAAVHQRSPSPIKLNSSQKMLEKEVESDVARRKISEKFPNSFSEYLPLSKSSPVSQLLRKTVPQSSLVSEFRVKLNRLMEMRANLENNLLVVQRKPKLNEFAIGALADQLKKEDWSNINDENVEMCWIQKIVDEQIKIKSAEAKEGAKLELQIQAKKTLRGEKQPVKRKPVKAIEPKKQNTSNVNKKKTNVTKAKKQSLKNDEDEATVTHIYGKADYHPHRSTVHQPFMHISPIKSPKYRTKRALQSIPVNHVRSEKSQTKFSSPAILRSKYLAPTAVSLGPPQIHENDPDPVIVCAAEPVVIVSKPSPIHQPIPKPPTVPKIKKVEIVDLPDEVPGNLASFVSVESDEPEPEDACLKFKGEGNRHPPVCKKVPLQRSKPASPKKIDTNLLKQTSAEDKIKCWVEQEIMSRILGQLYPMSSHQETQTLNLETDGLKNVIENEIRDQIRQRMMRQPKAEKSVVTEPVPVRFPVTPIATPQSTPTPSISARSPILLKHSIKTPSLSPQSSIAATEPSISENTPPRVATPVQELEIAIVSTPQVTPIPSSPEESIKTSFEEESVKESVKSAHSLIDPWEGRSPEEDANIAQTAPKFSRPTALEPSPTDLVVRPITPPSSPVKEIYSSTSESSSSEDSFKTEDKTISEGQLVIEHGEMIPKRHHTLLVPEHLNEFMKDEATLKDADGYDFDPASEGEFRPRLRKNILPKKSMNYVEDDPTGIYARPRKPLNTSDTEDASVGEISMNKRNKFYKWKSSRKSFTTSPSPQNEVKYDNPLSVGDLNATNTDSSSIAEEMPSNVIMVASTTTQVSHLPTVQQSNEKLDVTSSDLLFRDSLDDPLSKPRNQMTLTLPTTELQSAASDTEDISVQEL